jgi:hypothetical protein
VAHRDDLAAYAANWRTILVFDAAIGLLVMAAGVALVATGSRVVGVVMAAAGVGYTALVGARARRWHRLRSDRLRPDG